MPNPLQLSVPCWQHCQKSKHMSRFRWIFFQRWPSSFLFESNEIFYLKKNLFWKNRICSESQRRQANILSPLPAMRRRRALFRLIPRVAAPPLGRRRVSFAVSGVPLRSFQRCFMVSSVYRLSRICVKRLSVTLYYILPVFAANGACAEEPLRLGLINVWSLLGLHVASPLPGSLEQWEFRLALGPLLIWCIAHNQPTNQPVFLESAHSSMCRECAWLP